VTWQHFKQYRAQAAFETSQTDSSEGGSIPFNINLVSESISNAQAKASNCVRRLSLHHVGGHVTDLETSISFYESVFGLTVAKRLSLGRERIGGWRTTRRIDRRR
jgi:catechol-2,3-dioxygenase